MEGRKKETFMTRITSVGFVVLALAVFRPFGLGEIGWVACLHLLVIFVLGVGVCYITEAILKYVVRMPASLDEGIDYIIRRNLWFQVINTPLCALIVCLYLQLTMGRWVERDPLTWAGYFQTLIVIAFCSFAIGLYWRFKFRSRYLAAELEEVRFLNDRLQAVQMEVGETEPASMVTISGTTNDAITLNAQDLIYAESVGNYVKVCFLRDGKVHSQMIRTTSFQTEESLKAYPMIVRCHRAFLVNLAQVECFVSVGGNMQLVLRHCKDRVPVSRSHVAEMKVNINPLSL